MTLMTIRSIEHRVRVVAHYEALKKLGQRWPPDRIARELDVSESTVKRDQNVIKTGPQPILPAAPLAAAVPAPDGGHAPGRVRVPAAAAVLLAAAVLAVALAACVALVARVAHPAAPAYQLCVRYGTGSVTGIAGGGCPPGWRSVTLTPGGNP